MVNNAWQHRAHRRAAIVFEQMEAARRLAEEAKTQGWAGAPDDVDDLLERSPYMGLLDRLYGEDFQLAILLDRSDLLLHAEGPAAHDALPALRAATWLCDVADRQLRHLVLATMDLAEPARRAVSGAIDLRLTGMAPGSLYAGFKLMPPDDDLLPGDEQDAFHQALRALRALPILPRYIDDDAISPALAEAMPDPAVRDASMLAAYHLAPTGRRGIHTLGISVPGGAPSELGQRERVVLQDALRRPPLKGGIAGKFVGEVREFDLDKTRFHLRGVPDVGALRCVMAADRVQAKRLLGEQVEVTGSYATDDKGRPRLMLVEEVRILTPPQQTEIRIGDGA